MFTVEKKILIWLEKHLFVLVIVGVTLLSACIRFAFLKVESGDAVSFLLPWYYSIKEDGLRNPVGNYNLLYQFLIALMTYLPIKPLYAYKALSICFDYLLAAAVAFGVYKLVEDNRKWKAVLAYAIVLLLPTVFLNSAAWSQCDAIYTFFIIISLLAFFKEKYVLSFAIYGMAFAFKLQAVFVLPLYLFVYFKKKKFSCLHFVIIPAVVCLTGLPCVLLGKRNITEVFSIYFEQAAYDERPYSNYPSFWAIVSNNDIADPGTLRNVAILFTIAILGSLMVCWIVKKVKINSRNMLYMAFLLAYTCVLFLTGMHERYGYCYEIMAVMIALLNKKTILLLFPLYLLPLYTYGAYLYGNTVNLNILAVVNLAVYVGYLLILNRDMFSDTESSTV